MRNLKIYSFVYIFLLIAILWKYDFCISRDEKTNKDAINSMPGVYRYGISQLENMLQPLIAKGLQSVLLFGVSQHLDKVILTNCNNIEREKKKKFL